MLNNPEHPPLPADVNADADKRKRNTSHIGKALYVQLNGIHGLYAAIHRGEDQSVKDFQKPLDFFSPFQRCVLKFFSRHVRRRWKRSTKTSWAWN